MNNDASLVEITPEAVRLFLYVKMHEAGHTPSSLARHLGVTRQAMSKLLKGDLQPGPELLKALGLRWTYVVEEHTTFPPGPMYEEVQARRAMQKALPKKRTKS